MLRRCLLSAVLLAVFAAQGRAAGPTVSVGAGVLSLAPGETLPVSVKIADIQNVYGFEMEFKFDPSVVQVVDADPNAPGVQLLPGDFLSSDLIVRNSANNAAGAIQYAVTQLNPSVPKSGSGTLFTLNIEAGTAGKSGRIEVVKALFATRDGELIPVAASSGEVVVAAQTTVEPTVTPQPSRTPSPTSVPPTATLPRSTSTPRPSETVQSTSAPEQASPPTATRSSSAPTLTSPRAWADGGIAGDGIARSHPHGRRPAPYWNTCSTRAAGSRAGRWENAGRIPDTATAGSGSYRSRHCSTGAICDRVPSRRRLADIHSHACPAGACSGE